MKLRQQKTSFLDLKPRFQAKYKKLKQLNYNFLNTNKVLKLHRQKWSFLRKRNKARFYNRIFSNINNRLTLKKIKKSKPRFHPQYTYRYKSILNAKRIFRIWYSIKRMKVPGNLYYKRFNFIQKNKIFQISRITSLIFQFEKRLDVLLLRVFFFSSLYEVQKLILMKNILVNKKYITYFNTYLQLGDLIEVKSYKHSQYTTNSLVGGSLMTNPQTVVQTTSLILKNTIKLIFLSLKSQILKKSDCSFIREFESILILKKQLHIVYNLYLKKQSKQILEKIKIKNKFFYSLFTLVRVFRLCSKKRLLIKRRKSRNLSIKPRVPNKIDMLNSILILKKYCNIQFNSVLNNLKLKKLNLISYVKKQKFVYSYKKIKSVPLFYLFKKSLDRHRLQIQYRELDSTRLLILYQLKKILNYKYKPKFLMLLNYLHLEINYNILTIRLQQPFLNNLQLKVLYPFRFNYQVLQEYFDNNH